MLERLGRGPPYGACALVEFAVDSVFFLFFFLFCFALLVRRRLFWRWLLFFSILLFFVALGGRVRVLVGLRSSNSSTSTSTSSSTSTRCVVPAAGQLAEVAEAKIAHLAAPVVVEQEVEALEVVVDDGVIEQVEKVHAARGIKENAQAQGPVELGLLLMDDLVQRSSRHELHDDHDRLETGPKVHDNVGVAKGCHDGRLRAKVHNGLLHGNPVHLFLPPHPCPSTAPAMTSPKLPCPSVLPYTRSDSLISCVWPRCGVRGCPASRPFPSAPPTGTPWPGQTRTSCAS